MPSFHHESIVQLFRANPGLVPSLLREVFGLELPDLPVFIEDASLPSLTPVAYEADLVVRLGDAHAVVVEVQLRIDGEKRFSWPVYLANLRARCRLPVLLLVVTPRRSVARWAAEPIELGPPGWTLRAMVLGPERIPVVTSPAAASANPELLVLSAMAHGRGPRGVDIATAALESWGAVDIPGAELYLDLILESLNEAARLALELRMHEHNYQVRNAVLRDIITTAESRGEALGEARGEATAILEVLSERGVTVDEATRQRLLACTDSTQLRSWLRRAVHASTARDLFDA